MKLIDSLPLSLTTATQEAQRMTITAQTLKATTLSRPKQTAEHFQISIMTLHRWSKQSGFPQPLKRGQIVLYDTAAIESWLNSGNLK